MLNVDTESLLFEGTVIPAHPLAVTSAGRIDEMRQRRLTRYYLASGAGGVAVGVHTTQFEIRKPGIDMLKPVLTMAMEEMSGAGRPVIRVAGILGSTRQAVQEATLARDLGYDLGLLSMGGLADQSEAQLIERARAVGEVIPLFGFYLQPAVGGRVLSYAFWRGFAEIPAVRAIKVAAFNRYQTLDVVRAVCASGRRDEVALYTGNDDSIVNDLLTPYRLKENNKVIEKRMVGGLLGHWAVWTKSAVDLLGRIKEHLRSGKGATSELLALGAQVTDMNAAVFDAAHSFHGCIPGIHEVLRRQGLLEGTWCLNPDEQLAPGQAEEIGRVTRDYPHLIDDAFVRDFLGG